MTAIQAALVYIGLHILLLLALKLNVGRVRAGEKVLLGDAGNERLQRAMRVQGNAVEDVPVVLVGLLALAVAAAPIWLIHALGGGLFVGRVFHALGLGGSSGTSLGRFLGTLLSLLVLLGAGAACLWLALN